MAKWVCPVCGYVYEGDAAPEKCPQCGVPGSKFKKEEPGKAGYACEHVIGDGKVDDAEVTQGLKDHFMQGFHRVFSRGVFTKDDAALMLGVARQAIWAKNNNQKGKEN